MRTRIVCSPLSSVNYGRMVKEATGEVRNGAKREVGEVSVLGLGSAVFSL